MATSQNCRTKNRLNMAKGSLSGIDSLVGDKTNGLRFGSGASRPVMPATPVDNWHLDRILGACKDVRIRRRPSLANRASDMIAASKQPTFQRAGFASTLLIVVVLLLPAVALAQSGAPKGNPRLASLGIEIWPEYDRPAALVILKAALAEGVKLPAAVALRLPAASGGPSAVAFSATADGKLLNLKHERAVAGDFVMLKFEIPERFFHVEFYEPIATNLPSRTYRYAWPGDLAAERVRVLVQEPASASAVSVEPNLDLSSIGADGLRYRAAELGAHEAGKPLPIVVRYTKLDTRTSANILKPKAGDLPFAAAPLPSATAASGGLPGWALALAGIVMLSLVGGVSFLWWRRRESPSAPPVALPCVKCGAPQISGNRFCGKCGAKLA